MFFKEISLVPFNGGVEKMEVQLQVTAPGDALSSVSRQGPWEGIVSALRTPRSITVSCSYCAAIRAVLPVYLYLGFKHCC